MSVKLPTYTVAVRRKGGITFYFQIPPRLRPEGWAGACRLPQDSTKRTGRGDAAEIAAVEADAKTLYEQLKNERRGTPGLARAHTLPWLIASFDRLLADKGRSKATKRAYAYCARAVTAWSAGADHPHVRLITRPGVLQFLETMSANPTKRRHVASYLRSLMTHAMDKGLRTDNPCLRLGLETPEAQVRLWTDADVAAAIAAADGMEPRLEGIATAIAIAYDEGPRPGDILKLQRHREYSPKDGTLRYFQNKTAGWVTSPVSPRVRDRLAAQPDTQLMLVVNPRTGRRYNDRVFARDFHKVMTAAKRESLEFRHLRHSFTVNAKRAGLDEFEIASKTGHNPKSVRDMLARHYLPHDSEVAKNATAKIEAYRKRKQDELLKQNG